MVKVNAMGMACPLPVIEAKKALRGLTEGGVVEVTVDNEISVQNLQKLARHEGLENTAEKRGDGEYAVTITVPAGKVFAPAEEEDITCAPGEPAGQGTVIVISSDKMGEGEEALGKTLIKAFLFAVTKQDVLPRAILFYNRGAFLTTEGSESLEDLKALESAGVEITTCGTCLNYYGLTEKLQVGTVSNMYDIVATQMSAARVLKP